MLAGGQLIQKSQTQEAAIENEEQFIDAVLAQETPDPVVADINTSPENIETTVSAVRDLLSSRWTEGDVDAPVQVVMISDYQCPDCRMFELNIQSVLEKRDDVSLSVKHFPMCADCNPNISRTMHANACWAARAAETAGILGGEQAFWEMHRWLFQNKGKFPDRQLPPLVEDLGFDRQEFTQIMRSDETLDLVHQDIEDAIALGLFYTPMIFINGVELKWHMLPSSLSHTVNSVADEIASGRANSKRVTPPVGIEKYVADWQDGRIRKIEPSNRDFRRKDRMGKAPQVTAFVDFTSPNSAVFMHDLKEWEDTHGETDLILRINPLSHDCNPNLPKRLKNREGSCMSARALKAAGLVGGDDAHFKMAWWLIENGYKLDEIDEATIIDQAVVLGMDGAQFAQTMNSLGVEDLVEQDVIEFKKHKFPHMPAVLLEGRQIPRLTLDGYSVIGSALDRVNQQASED
ncbi:MAG: thioredoxin domain-containing protein [Phycisphaerales bacterium]|nr:thioredoxin domain-containing protein [Phycisphaerales bacterium]